MVLFPLRDFVTGDAELTEIWPDVIRHFAQVFADHATFSRFLHHHPEILLPVAAIPILVFIRVIGSWLKPWRPRRRCVRALLQPMSGRNVAFSSGRQGKP